VGKKIRKVPVIDAGVNVSYVSDETDFAAEMEFGALGDDGRFSFAGRAP